MIEIEDLIGIPYKIHGRDKNGYDCYGLVLEVTKRFGHPLEEFPDSYDTDRFIKLVESESVLKIVVKGHYEKTDKLQAGNILLIYDRKGRLAHTGVVLNHDDYIHCDQYGVRVSQLRYEPRKWEQYKWQN